MMRGRSGWALGLMSWVALAWGLLPSDSLGAGWREVEGAWLVPPELAAGLLDREIREGGGRTWHISLGTGQLFALPELNQRSFGVNWRGQAAGVPTFLRMRWSRLGDGLYSESRGTGQILLGQRPGIGLAAEHTGMAIEGRAVPRALRWQFLVGYQWGDERKGRFWLRLAHPLPGRMTEEGGSPRRQDFLEAGWQRNHHALVVLWDQDDRGRPLLGGDFLWKAGPGVGVCLRWDPATGSLGPGLQVLRRGLLLRTSHMVHPWLGVSHRFSLGLGGGHE